MGPRMHDNAPKESQRKMHMGWDTNHLPFFHSHKPDEHQLQRMRPCRSRLSLLLPQPADRRHEICLNGLYLLAHSLCIVKNAGPKDRRHQGRSCRSHCHSRKRSRHPTTPSTCAGYYFGTNAHRSIEGPRRRGTSSVSHHVCRAAGNDGGKDIYNILIVDHNHGAPQLRRVSAHNHDSPRWVRTCGGIYQHNDAPDRDENDICMPEMRKRWVGSLLF